MGFVFTVCTPGMEGSLKDDVARHRPALRLAFSRPGFVTFKIDGDVPPEVPRPSPWARAWGASLGRAAHADDALKIIPGGSTRLHVYARNPEVEGAVARVAEVETELREVGGPKFIPGGVAATGDLVTDVIVAAGEPNVVVGVHVHEAGRSPHPGGALPVEIPGDAPSRAYAKVEEAIAWAGLPVKPGQVAVEIGSAPGGAAYALVRRGVTVWGVDPGLMDRGVIEFVGPGGARVHHVAETLASVRWEALPRRVDWLLMDVNLAPPVAIHGLGRLVPAWKHSLRAAVLTLKMNDAAVRRALPTYLERVAGLGFADVQVTHLPSNRAELCVIARR